MDNFYKKLLENKINTLRKGDKFIVKDLFVGVDFANVDEEFRMALGNEFYHMVLNNEFCCEVLYDDDRKMKKTDDNQQIYIKK